MTLRWIVAVALIVFCLAPASPARAQQPPYGGGGDAVDCVSRNFSFMRCEVPWRDVRLVRQLSDTACIRGQNWGLDKRGLWVDRGCGGRFVAAGHGGGPGYGGGGWRPEPGWDTRFDVRCDSKDYRYRFCSVDLGGAGRAYVSRQISGSPCIEGRTWGWNRAGIWVDQGCDAEFTIDRRWR
jgi:hypothetical protein